MPARAYEVGLTPDGELSWMEYVEGERSSTTRSPGTSFWKRLSVSLMSLLPIEWLL